MIMTLYPIMISNCIDTRSPGHSGSGRNAAVGYRTTYCDILNKTNFQSAAELGEKGDTRPQTERITREIMTVEPNKLIRQPSIMNKLEDRLTSDIE